MECPNCKGTGLVNFSEAYPYLGKGPCAVCRGFGTIEKEDTAPTIYIVEEE